MWRTLTSQLDLLTGILMRFNYEEMYLANTYETYLNVI